MLKIIGMVALPAWAFLLSTSVMSADFGTAVPMRNKGADTYYVRGQIDGVGEIDLLVDTGSSYSTIGQDTLDVLTRNNRAVYVKKLTGIMADGSKMTVPVYRIGAVAIGSECWLNDVEAAVFPNSTRFILGISGLRQAAPFIFSLDPPQLVLSNCEGLPTTVPRRSQPPAVSNGSSAADVAMPKSEVEAAMTKKVARLALDVP